jgi:hypothetical protein
LVTARWRARAAVGSADQRDQRVLGAHRALLADGGERRGDQEQRHAAGRSQPGACGGLEQQRERQEAARAVAVSPIADHHARSQRDDPGGRQPRADRVRREPYAARQEDRAAGQEDPVAERVDERCEEQPALGRGRGKEAAHG